MNPEVAGIPEPKWRSRQMAALIGYETRRNLLSRRAIGLYVLAALPVAVFAGLALARSHGFGPLAQGPEAAAEIFAGVFDALGLRTVIFFGCGWLFIQLVRGDIANRSLHYYLLAPLSRGAFLAGKYAAGVIVAVSLFGGATLVSLALAGWPGGGLRAVEYFAIAALGSIAYGALFCLLGVMFANPVLPILVVYGWEWINFLLPPLLQRASILHYLQALAPLPVAGHSIAFIAPPIAPAEAVAILAVFSVVLVWASAVRMRRVEIKYEE